MFDIAIVGAGIAGASLAAELAAHGARVVLLEAEDGPATTPPGARRRSGRNATAGPTSSR